MFYRTSPSLFRRTPAFLAGAALLGTCALASLPAQAASVENIENPFVPENSTHAVTFGYTAPDATEPSPEFPAGNYWIFVDQFRWTLPFWLEGLSDVLAPPSYTIEVVTLDAPGPIVLDVPAGVAGTLSYLSVVEVPADAPDPTGLSDDELVDFIQALPNDGAPVDLITMTAARITKVAASPDLETHLDGAPYPDLVVEGDFLGIDAGTTAYRNGNRITVLGLNGESRSFFFGRRGDTLLVGDWNNDGRVTFGIRRGNQLFLDDDLDGGWAEHVYTFGRAGDEVLVGDWDGDGKDTIALRRGNTFYVTNDFEGGWAPTAFVFGRATDGAYAADWDGDGKDTISVLRGLVVHVKNTLTGGAADATYSLYAE